MTRFPTQLEQLKSEFAKNRGKSVVLGALTLVLAFFAVRMLWSGAPRAASASTLAPAADAAGGDPVRSREMAEKVREGAALWQILRERRGIDASLAFSFDSQYYTLDPARRIVTAEPDRVEVAASKPEPQMTEKELALFRYNRAKQEIKMLRLQAIMMGDEPTALLNNELKHVGDRVLGFTIKSIQERQVLVEKDGVTVPVEMAK